MNSEVGVAIVTGIFGIITLIIKAVIDRKKHKHIDLNLHPFFMRMAALNRHISTTFMLVNKGKQEIFREVLKQKIDITVEHLKKAIPEMKKCFQSGDSNALYFIHMTALEDSMQTFQYFYEHDNFTTEERRALKIVVRKFNAWNKARVNYMLETVQMVCNSPFYPDCYTKASVLFDLYLGMFIDVITDAEKTLNDINGDLEGITFRGYKV